MRKSAKLVLWKAKLGEARSLAEVESALDMASEKVRQDEPEAAVGQIERVDFRDRETVVYLSATEAFVEPLARTLRAQSPEAKVDVRETDAQELYEFP